MDQRRHEKNGQCNNTVALGSDVDTAHPRFVDPPTAQDEREHNHRNQYYCSTCIEYFPMTVNALRAHFLHGVPHKGFACIYCKRPAYIYTHQFKKHIFHSCCS